MNKALFKEYHPLVLFSYYFVMLLIVMSTTNPVILSICFFGSLFLQLVHLKERKKKSVFYPLFFLAIITITNPLFVHRGATILFFLFNKPITKEAFIYGFFMGMMIATVIYCFQNLQAAIDSEHFFYLFGKRFPKATLILALVFRFIPLLQNYYRELNQVQTTVQKMPKQRFSDRAFYGLDLFGQLFSWSLENAMDTADSMKARGYGMMTRSSRLSYRLSKTDMLLLILFLLTGIFFIVGMVNGRYQFNYYPYYDHSYLLVQQYWLNYLVVFILAFLPLFNRVGEVIAWTILKSRI